MAVRCEGIGIMQVTSPLKQPVFISKDWGSSKTFQGRMLGFLAMSSLQRCRLSTALYYSICKWGAHHLFEVKEVLKELPNWLPGNFMDQDRMKHVILEVTKQFLPGFDSFTMQDT